MCSMYICRMYILVQTSYISCICMKIHVALALFFVLVRQNIKLSETPNHENKMRSGMDSFSLWIKQLLAKPRNLLLCQQQTAVFHSPKHTIPKLPASQTVLYRDGRQTINGGFTSMGWGCGDVFSEILGFLIHPWRPWVLRSRRRDDDFMDLF